MKKIYSKPVTEIIVVKDIFLAAQSDEEVELEFDFETEDEGYGD